jgi:hypothetical protein
MMTSFERGVNVGQNDGATGKDHNDFTAAVRVGQKPRRTVSRQGAKKQSSPRRLAELCFFAPLREIVFLRPRTEIEKSRNPGRVGN